MSGTSLDGVDLAYCIFSLKNKKWSFTIEEAMTISYPNEWIYNLKEAIFKDREQLKKLDILYGDYLGNRCKHFMTQHNLQPDLIASHGHTIFHQPEKGFTLQIGNGNQIAKIAGIKTVYDFRSLDVRLGGQGAPLVPIGDKFLFPDYDFCLNLGGFSNISFERNGQRIAFDICPVNVVINTICKTVDLDYDKDGSLAKKGTIHPQLLSELNNIPFYQKNEPKSLGIEFVLEYIYPLLKKYDLSIEDKLRTYYEHIAIQTAKIINPVKGENVLITGGGAYNNFLIACIKTHINKESYIPSKVIIDFKEALIFGLLGILKLKGENNCLASVTGASEDCSGGKISFP